MLDADNTGRKAPCSLLGQGVVVDSGQNDMEGHDKEDMGHAELSSRGLQAASEVGFLC